jgi:hypothetical protein
MAERAVRLVDPDDARVALSRVAMNGVREGEVGAYRAIVVAVKC